METVRPLGSVDGWSVGGWRLCVLRGSRGGQMEKEIGKIWYGERQARMSNTSDEAKVDDCRVSSVTSVAWSFHQTQPDQTRPIRTSRKFCGPSSKLGPCSLPLPRLPRNSPAKSTHQTPHVLIPPMDDVKSHDIPQASHAQQ